MHRSWLLVLSLLFISAFGFGQSTSSDSQGMQALVAEVRQLRMDLRATNGNALKAQLLLYRFQVQEAAVARVSQRVNDLRSMLAGTQKRRRDVAAGLKLNEDLVDNTDTSQELRQQAQQEISRLKPELEGLAAEEQQRQSAEMEAEEQLREEQAKLDGLEDRVEQLEKVLSSNPP